MKLYKYITCICLGLMVFSSCKKDFLDKPTPQNGDLTDNIIFSTKAGAQNALTGIYWIFRSENYNGYGGQNPDFSSLTNRGLQTTMFSFEMKTNDLLDVYGGTYWWGNEATWKDGYNTRDAQGPRTYQIWDMFYKAINNANAVIKYTPSVTDASSAEKDAIIAEAKAIRAYSYFWLARVYQFTYAKNPDAPGIPVYTEPASKEAKGNPRASLKTVYALITSDIESAIALLPAGRVDKYRINKDVAQAIAAQVYQELAMADASLWDKVISNAQAARASYPLMSNASYAGGFNDLSNGEWIWGLPVPSDQSLTYYSIYSFMDWTNGYYRNIGLNTDLTNQYSATDGRSKVILSNSWATPTNRPTYQRYTSKFTSKTAGQMIGDIVLIRSAQLLLIEAEALAQENKLPEAINKMFELQVLRDPVAVKPALSSKSDVINAILTERVKEMFGENGGIYFDLKRLQLPLVRNGNHPNIVNIPASDARWNMKLPQKEIDSNQSLSSADQNP